MFDPWWCIACILCGGAPDWPDNAVANAAWVEDAIEWRLDKGIDGCDEITPAIDALTLEWVANSPDVIVDIETEIWPVFTEEPELQGPLIQSLALDILKKGEVDENKALKRLKKFAKRSGGVWDKETKEVFKRNQDLLK